MLFYQMFLSVYISLGQFSGLWWDLSRPSLAILHRLSPSWGLLVKSSSPV